MPQNGFRIEIDTAKRLHTFDHELLVLLTIFRQDWHLDELVR